MRFIQRAVGPAAGLAAAFGLLIGSGSHPAKAAELPAGSFRLAQAGQAGPERDAFEAAKELGTVEAWDAFLSNHPSGFYADLARAYVKKLAAPDPAGATVRDAPAAAPAAALMRPSIGRIEFAPSAKSIASRPTAAKLPCAQLPTLRTYSSDTPARISFINYSDDPIEVYWLDENGQQQLFGEIKKDRQASVETFLTHPWLIEDLSGTCLAVAMPNPGPQVFVIGEPAASGHANTTSPRTSKPSKSTKSDKPAKSKKSSSGCPSGQIRIEGRCMTRKAAVGYCGPGFRVVGNKCIHQNELEKPSKPKAQKCPKGQIWSAQEGCHYDD